VALAACLSGAEIRGLQRIDDHVYRGVQPGEADYQELARMGIKTILDLRGGWIHGPKEKKRAEAAGLGYVSIRLSGFWEPHDSQIAKALSILEDPARQPVFVHCRRGADRVGLVIACYRIQHDHWTNEQALQEAAQGRLSPLEVLMKRYIRHFDPARLPPPKP
jgi:protein tyrosine/serine phosphatase